MEKEQKITTIEFFEKAGKQIQLPEGVAAVAVCHNARWWPRVRYFCPINFQADSWEDVVSYAKTRVVAQTTVHYSNVSGNMQGLNSWYSIFFFMEEREKIEYRELCLSEIIHLPPRLKPPIKPESIILHEIAEKCTYLAKFELVHKRDIQIPVRRRFEGTAEDEYEVFLSRFREESLVEIRLKESHFQLFAHATCAEVQREDVFEVVDLVGGKVLFEFSGGKKQEAICNPPAVPPLEKMEKVVFLALRKKLHEQLPRGVAKRAALVERERQEKENLAYHNQVMAARTREVETFIEHWRGKGAFVGE